jgi:nitroimidazol reductase NimA-like FMN-containing flavoprotein (pyridoxamine 5'-phosphate oxidase superfamily)
MSGELDDLARNTIDTNRYLALGTADGTGLPWVSPVWFACEDYRSFHWVSSPDARHSLNLASRPEVAMSIYDSSQVPGTVEAVYLTGRAEELTEDELGRGIEVFDRISRRDLGRGWALSDVQPPFLLRLYRAVASEHFVLIRGRDPERGSGVDRRERVLQGLA